MAIDLRDDYPRRPREELDGIKLLPRAIDKARAQIAGTLGDYIYFDCGLNEVLFDTLGVTAEQFIDAVRDAGSTFTTKQDREALRDLRESLRIPRSERRGLSRLRQESEIDNAVVAWIRDGLATPQARIQKMNERVETLAPQTFAERAAFEKEVQRSAPGGSGIQTFPDLLDYQEGRLA